MHKVLIVEPSLLSNLGHPLEGTMRFAEFFVNEGFEVEVVSPDGSPGIEARIGLVSVKQRRILPRTYARFLNLPFAQPKLSEFLALASVKLPLPRKPKKALEKLSMGFWFLSEYSRTRRALKVLVSQINKDPKNQGTTTYFLPSADNLTSRALLKTLRRSKSNAKVVLRFIGVFENLAIPKLVEPAWIFRFVGKFPQVSLFAETQPMSDYISSFGNNCTVLDYPPFDIPSSDPSFGKTLREAKTPQDSMTFGLIGSGRPDQGFDQILEVSLACHKLGHNLMVQISETAPENKKLVENLKCLPNVVLLGKDLSRNDFSAALESIDCLILPYDVNTYRFRGSAMLYEAIDRLKPVIAPSGTGLGQTIRLFGLGFTYNENSVWPEILGRFEIPTSFPENARLFNHVRHSNLQKAVRQN